MEERESGSSSAFERWSVRPLPAALAVAYAAGIWWLSGRQTPVRGDSELWALIGNAFHFPLFAVLGFLVAEALGRSSGMSFAARVRVVGIVLAYGIIDELHQASVPGRVADPGDVATDGLGGLGGLLLWWGVRGPGQWQRSVLRAALVGLVALATICVRSYADPN